MVIGGTRLSGGKDGYVGTIAGSLSVILLQATLIRLNVSEGLRQVILHHPGLSVRASPKSRTPWIGKKVAEALQQHGIAPFAMIVGRWRSACEQQVKAVAYPRKPIQPAVQDVKPQRKRGGLCRGRRTIRLSTPCAAHNRTLDQGDGHFQRRMMCSINFCPSDPWIFRPQDRHDAKITERSQLSFRRIGIRHQRPGTVERCPCL